STAPGPMTTTLRAARGACAGVTRGRLSAEASTGGTGIARRDGTRVDPTVGRRVPTIRSARGVRAG
ncbi:MAG: hypothetical protein RLZZ163_1246, partial [Actinomycetota bacterium]